MLRTTLRNVLAHKSRLLMTVLAVCLGVAFISGSLVFADSTTAAYRASLTQRYAPVSVEPVSPPGAGPREARSALDDALVRRVAAVPGVASARPVADGSVALAAKDGTPLRPTGQAELGQAYLPQADGKDVHHPLLTGRAPRDGNEVALAQETARAGGYTLGDTVTLAVDGPVHTMRLVGIVGSNDPRVGRGATLAVFDKDTAQQLFCAPGRWSGIELTPAPGVDEYTLARDVGKVLPDGRAKAVTATARTDQQSAYIASKSKSYAQLPLLFAVVSLFIGSLLIVNTFTLLVAGRTKEIALLRAVGATRRQVARSVLAEATLLGLVASALGFVLGLGVAAALPAALATGDHPLPAGPLVIGPLPVIAALTVGVGVTVAAAWLPSRKAARIAPVEAMRAAAPLSTATASRARAALGAVLHAGGVGLLFSLDGADSASDAAVNSALAGTGLLVVGLLLLAPRLARPVVRTISRSFTRFGVSGALARNNALRDPRRTAATAVALMITTTLVTGLAVVQHSASRALDAQAAAGLSADYVISADDATSGSVDAAAVRRAAAVPGVTTASAVADSVISAGALAKEVSGIDPRTVGKVMNLHFTNGSATDIGPDRIAVSHTFARDHRLTTGSTIEASIGPGQPDRRLTVVGVYDDNPTARDALALREDVQRQSFLRDSLQRVLVAVDPAKTPADLPRRLRKAVDDSPLLKVQDRDQLVREQAGTAGTLLDLVFGLLALGVAISTLGMVNTLAMSVTERTREIGVLRAIGMDRADVRRMIRLESLAVATFGTLLGVAAGLFSAWKVSGLATGAIPQYTFSPPWGTLTLTVVLALTVGVAAAALPARRAARLGPFEAVATS
ncbi:ABC transporter permease [Streptomyces sp. NPDC058663]|uniref:ABC transporter permease n=1 Tax=Streptomyces sp. NPDC058663 TaxID=3346584 RepID=UPI00365560C9